MPRIALAPAVIVVVVAALTLSPGGAQAAPKRCKHGTVAWRLQGRRGCAPNPAKSTSQAPVAATLMHRMVSHALAKPHRRAKAPKRLRRAVPRLVKDATKLTTRAAGAWHHAGAASAGHGSVVDTLDETLGSATLADGTQITARSHAVAFEDESKSLSLQLEATNGKQTLRLEPNIDDLLTHRPEVACPTADGLVTADGKSTQGNTFTLMEGKRVVGASTERSSVSYSSRGQVGPDAHLQHVTTQIVVTQEHYERGLQYKATARATVTMTRDGAPQLQGTPSIDVDLRVAGASRAQERAEERRRAAAEAGDPDTGRALAGLGANGRSVLLQAEPTWYDIPNNCAEIRWDPAPGADVAPKQHLPVGGQVTTRDGEPGTGTIQVTDVPLGAFGPGTASFTPAKRALFTATGAQPNQDHATVLVHVLGASTAGRATMFWSAGHAQDLPARFTGTLAASSLIPGARSDDWAGTATYTLQQQFPKPDGSTSAIYALTGASLVAATTSVGDAPSGCRVEASGTGGNIADGDIEIRVAKDGTATYALLYDVEIPATLTPVDCQPGSAPPPLALPILGMVNSHVAGWPAHESFRNAPKDWHLAVKDTADVAAAPGSTVSASWDLQPAK